ncbi:MAG: 4,5-DOPA dioxygenase extradiol [Rhodospirillaceae bacterium]
MTARMPVLFIGHGSPMNAIADNAYTRTLDALGRRIARPRAILCISAHWMTEGTWITHQAQPRTIHDFYGFAKPLFEVQYPAPGDPALAEAIAERITDVRINLDDEQWGFDHGAWSVLRHLFPAADVPVLQLSLHMEKSARFHYVAGRALAPLRDQGILILGSGNIVHNLRLIKWDDSAAPYPWAEEFDAWTAEKLGARDDAALVNEAPESEAGKLSIPTPEHWYPFLYALGAADPREKPEMVFEGVQNASISMRSVAFGLGG